MGQDTSSTAQAETRKLAAIMFTDIVGFSHQMGADEARMLRVLEVHNQVIQQAVADNHGHVIKTMGDAFLVDFPSVVNAVQCAQRIQNQFRAHNAEKGATEQIHVRIGIHLGDIVQRDGDVFGDGVNVASRLQALAEPDTVCISHKVYEEIEKKLPLGTVVSLGRPKLKNIAPRFQVYALLAEKPKGFRQNLRMQRLKLKQWRRTLQVAVLLLMLLGAGALGRYFYFPSSPALLLPDKPSIVVLPFTNMSGDPEQEYFSDGLTEDLTSDLSKISSLFVIARNSAFTYKGKAAKVQEVSKELGVRYVLEGSVRKANSQIRITAQLIDATTGYHLWTERYDRPLQDLFAVQDEIVQQIVTRLRVEVREAELERVRHIPTANLTAYDYWLRGQESFWRLTPEGNVQAKQMLEKALELDPTSARAYALLGAIYWREWLLQAGQDSQTLERALALAQKAVELDSSLPGAHGTLGWVSLWKKQYEQAIAETEQDIALDPNSADGYLRLGNVLAWAGRPGEAIGMIEKAMRLNPRYPAAYLNTLGFAYVLLGRYAEAIPPLQQALSRNPNFPDAHTNLAVCYAELGREEEARAEVAEILRLGPHFSVGGLKQLSPYKDPAVGERYLAALRKAGLK